MLDCQVVSFVVMKVRFISVMFCSWLGGTDRYLPSALHTYLCLCLVLDV